MKAKISQNLKALFLKNRCLIMMVLAVAGGFFLGGFLLSNSYFENLGDNHEMREAKLGQSNYRYINPLLECDFRASSNRNMNAVKNSIEKIINKNVYKKELSAASVYYRDLNNGPWFGINEDADFSPASLIKVPVMMAYYYEAENNPAVLEKEILATEDYDYSEQNIEPEYKLEKGKKYKVEDLIERMLVYSDNYAYYLLLDNVNPEKIEKVYVDLGISLAKVDDPSGNIISVKSYSSLFRVLFNSSYLNKYYSEKALAILTRTKFYNGLVAGTPINIEISHKFGERRFLETGEVQLHDCGIVYYTDNPYLLCVMSKGQDLKKLSSFIKEVSAIVFDYVKLNNKSEGAK